MPRGPTELRVRGAGQLDDCGWRPRPAPVQTVAIRRAGVGAQGRDRPPGAKQPDRQMNAGIADEQTERYGRRATESRATDDGSDGSRSRGARESREFIAVDFMV